MDLILHSKPNLDSSALAPYVADRAGVDLEDLQVLPNKIRLSVHQDKLRDLAALDSINRIEEVRQKSVYNDQARGILRADALFTSTGYQGAGQIICVADTGFDQGIAENDSNVKVHPAFAGRVERLVSLWVPGDAKDPVGHGTHVCGSVCGSGIYSDSGLGQDISVQGTAPAAKLMVQSMSKRSDSGNKKGWIIEPPAALSTLFSVPYDLGIRIHNNSWGDTWDEKTGQLGYEADATAIDTFICSHQDFVVLIAAGNDARQKNHGVSQIGDNGAAKNCITVGATGTSRSNNGEYYDPKVPALSGATDTAVFSSRGPTKSTINSASQAVAGRIKPDVVAPGVVILSAASRSLAAGDRVRVRYGTSGDMDWLFMSGTSMATPLVTGCVALIREALQEHGKQYASAALVKALLVNGAVNYSSPNGPGFDGEQGFGRVDIDSSITMIRQSAFIDGGSHAKVSKYDTSSLRITADEDSRWESPPLPIPSGRHRLLVTLVYPDPPGALLQNDVNLIVRVDGLERHGNMGSDMGFDHTSKFPCFRPATRC